MALNLAALEHQLSASTPMILRFSPELEQDFEQEEHSTRVSRAVMGCWALVIFEILLVVYDTAYAYHGMSLMQNFPVQVRLGLCACLLAVILVLRHIPLGFKIREGGLVTLLWITLVVGTGLAVDEPHVRCQLELYALGVIPMIGGVLMQLRFPHALVMSLAGLLFLILVSHLSELPYPYMAFSVSFVFMAFSLFSLMANYLTERSARHLYLMNCMDHLTLQDTVSRNQHLHAMARLDSLTGLYNRRYLVEALAHYIRRDTSEGPMANTVQSSAQDSAMTLPALPRGHCLALALIDIDHFKAFNDSYGHVEGDRCLSLLAETLKESVGERGIVVRYGGEEFIALIPVLDVSEALQQAQTLRRAVADLGVVHRASEIGHVTLSLGLVVHSRVSLRKLGRHFQDDDVESLLHAWIQQADEALYQAKQNGRNQVCLARSGTVTAESESAHD